MTTPLPLDPDTLGRVLAESAPDPIVTIDEASIIQSVNSAAEQVFGYAAEELVGRSLHVLIPERLRAGHAAGMARYLATGVRRIPWQRVRVPIRTKAGTEVPVEISFGEFVAEGRRLFSGFLRDVSERVEHERVLAEAHARLQAQAEELELANQQLQDTAVELEAANDELHATAAALEERTEDAEDAMAQAEAARREAEAERARATAILETMADAHFVLDADFRIVSANAAMERGIGLSRGEMLGRTIWELFPGALGTEFERAYRRVAAEGVEVHFVAEYAERELALVAEVDAYPTPGGIAVFWRDIAPRRRAEAALAESERQLRIFADTMPALAWTARADGYRDWYNARWYEYTGTTPAQMEGWGWQAVHDPALLPGVVARWRASVASGEPFEATLALRGADGRFRRFLTRVMPVRDADGRVLRWFGVNTDVEAERAAREAAEAANAAKGQFLSTMSHELRTPLNAIAGYADLLTMGLRGPLTETQRQDIERIRRANQHLMALVTDVLNFARLDAGQVEFHVADVPLASVVADLEPLLAPQLAARGLAFDHDLCAPHQPHLVRADPEKLRQILLNLLTNAVKFTDPGGRVSLACDADAATGMVRVRVADTGRGIPADQLERIFEPFVQVDRHRTHESQQGIGLGLAISRDLARGMGGDLVVESEEGRGSTFTVTLPGAAAGAD